MKKEEIKLHLVDRHTSIMEAMRKIQENADGIVFVVDSNGRLEGSVTDGDVRRWLIKTGNIDVNVDSMMHRNTRFIGVDEMDSAEDYLRNNKVLVVPVLDDERRIIDIVIDTNIRSWRKKNGTSLAGIDVIIMAGGKGTRLQPYTKILPKPLIPINDIPIIERIMNKLACFGASEFYITLNYKKEMIKAYFNEQKLPYEINFVEEEEPLGTAGSIRLIKKTFNKPIIVTNCDILIEADFDDIMIHHTRSANDMTIVASLKKTMIPYGVLHTEENGLVTSMEEKPEISVLINTGMYIINPEVVELIPKKEFYHMPWLAKKLIDLNRKVGMYPIGEGDYLDMGQYEEMRKMEEKLSAKS